MEWQGNNRRKIKAPPGRGLSSGALKIVFVVYILLLLKVIVFKMPLWQMKEIIDTWTGDVIWEGMDRANFVPFKTIRMYWRYWGRGLNSFGNLVGNVVVFIPLGYLLPRIYRRAQNIFLCMGLALLFVVLIEVFQLLSALGSFDVDDIILNCGGALLGFIFFHICKTFWGSEQSN